MKLKLAKSITLRWDASPHAYSNSSFKTVGGADWRTRFAGTEIGAGLKRSFEPVAASTVRLNILDATDWPAIVEVEPE